MPSDRTPAPPRSDERLKPDPIRVGDFVYCRSRRYRDQLQLPEELALVLETKRSIYKVVFSSDRRAWLPREHLARLTPETDPGLVLQRLHHILLRVQADECEMNIDNSVVHAAIRIDRMDAATMDDLRLFLKDALISLSIVPEGMAFMKIELTFGD